MWTNKPPNTAQLQQKCWSWLPQRSAFLLNRQGAHKAKQVSSVLYKQGQEKGLWKYRGFTENTELCPLLHPPKAEHFLSLVLPCCPHLLFLSTGISNDSLKSKSWFAYLSAVFSEDIGVFSTVASKAGAISGYHNAQLLPWTRKCQGNQKEGTGVSSSWLRERTTMEKLHPLHPADALP